MAAACRRTACRRPGLSRTLLYKKKMQCLRFYRPGHRLFFVAIHNDMMTDLSHAGPTPIHVITTTRWPEAHNSNASRLTTQSHYSAYDFKPLACSHKQKKSMPKQGMQIKRATYGANYTTTQMQDCLRDRLASGRKARTSEPMRLRLQVSHRLLFSLGPNADRQKGHFKASFLSMACKARQSIKKPVDSSKLISCLSCMPSRSQILSTPLTCGSLEMELICALLAETASSSTRLH